VLSLIVASVLPVASTAEARLKHAPGCRSARCDLRVARIWGRHHHPAAREASSTISRFDLCVANRENGEPGADTYSTVNWHAVNEYDGAYSFLQSTWEAAGGMRFASSANLATPLEQSVIFNSYSRVDPGAWPTTIPPCLGE
jgi:hypothetical protein